jgi:putative transposase
MSIGWDILLIQVRQLTLARTSGWGGRRKGAGRKPVGRPCVPHRRRAVHRRTHPVSLTLRARSGLPSLRAPPLFAVVQECIAASAKDGFRVIECSVQRDHVHLLVEAEDHRRLVSGVQGLSIRIARAVNRVLGRRGSFWGDRYHARDLASPQEVRNAIVYILRNVEKHQPGTAPRPDPCSSAPWFNGFAGYSPLATPSPVLPARTWLATIGWRRAGPIQPHEAPRPAPPQRRP